MGFDGAPGVSRWDENCLFWLRVKMESRSNEGTKESSDCLVVDIVQPHNVLGAQSLSGSGSRRYPDFCVAGYVVQNLV